MDLLEKHHLLKNKFTTCDSKEALYTQIIEMGRNAPSFNEEWKVMEKRVHGCQSITYLHVEYDTEHGTLSFEGCSDALISAGLVQILIQLYDGAKAEDLLRTPPKVLEELKIPTILTPGRANGLASMWKRMQQLALEFVMKMHQ